jgi:hypothetical protein
MPVGTSAGADHKTAKDGGMWLSEQTSFCLSEKLVNEVISNTW